jgi:hypothetical protein
MKSVALLFVGLLCGGIAFGDDSDSAVKVNFAGQGRLRFEQSNRTDYVSRRSAFLLRVRPEVRLSRGTGLSFFLQPQFSKAFGKPEFIGSSTTANTSQLTSGSTYDTSMGVHQAVIEYRFSDSLQVIAGRQLISYGNEVVLSGLDWDNTGRSFDALKARYTHRWGTADLFYAKLFASSVTATQIGSGDNDLLGAYSSCNLGTGLDAVDFYLLYRSDRRTGATADLFAAGARVQAKLGDLDYRAEATKEVGAALTDPASAHQVDVEAGWNFGTPLKIRLGLELFLAGASYDQLYPLAHKYLGIADVFGRRNLQGAVLHLNASPLPDLSAQFDLHYLSRSSTATPVYQLNGSSPLGSGTNGSASVGTEMDLMVNYALAKDLSATVGGALLFPGSYLRAELGEVTPTFWYTQFIAQL